MQDRVGVIVKFVGMLILVLGLAQAETGINSLTLTNNRDSIHVSPRKAMLLSAIVPGTGQLYVRKPLKALLYSGAEAYCIRQVIYWNRIDNYVEEAQKKVGKEDWDNLSTEQKKDSVK